MSEIFGDFREDLPDKGEFLIIGFSPSSLPIQQRWRNNGLSADFVADYLTTFFPANDDDPASKSRQAEIKGAVSYIANELLENAMKFNDDRTQSSIEFGIHLLENDGNVKAILMATNSIAPEGKESFQTFIQEIVDSDPEEMYVRQLERSAEEENSGMSGLGLLTMLNDYGAQLGWKFETVSGITAVTTMVQIAV